MCEKDVHDNLFANPVAAISASRARDITKNVTFFPFNISSHLGDTVNFESTQYEPDAHVATILEVAALYLHEHRNPIGKEIPNTFDQ